MAGVIQVNAGYASTLAHSLLAEVLVSMEEQRNTVQPKNTTERRTSEISKAYLKFKNKLSHIRHTTKPKHIFFTGSSLCVNGGARKYNPR